MKPKKFSRDWTLRIRDISKIEQYIQNMTLSEFRKNELVIDAVIRNFEIIGEASRHIPISVQDLHPHIPWKQMVEMRNFLIHEYSGVDINTVWQTANTHLSDLKIRLDTIKLEHIH